MKRKMNYILLGITLLLAVFFLGFFTWSQQTYKPSSELNTLIEKDEINYEKDWIIFNQHSNNKIGIVLYPGAKVEPEAYSYYGKQLANKGYLVAIPHVRFNFALLDSNKAQEIIENYPSVEKWVIGGHSLGGVTAAKFAYNYPKKVDGVFLLGSYPSEGNEFSKTMTPMLSIYAEKDGLTTVDKINETKKLLSRNATMHEIKDGNHAQFGFYGKQKGDNEAGISIKMQQDEMISVTSEWIKEIN
ncbi:dienelactone hydrolase [Metabacillus crassostreae]|uniref:alpha/beta fold hydrolase n=1 Tax=Metabacillus crassostreae TaxID=929098 RepID=UPI00195E7AD1|nr:alpha/beta fold hydrolase [Metabacillus crassostreae]MBM7602679.1 dienelactone hydrolase [Metabacillus crassostreae]